MKKIFLFILSLLVICGASIRAEKAESFEQAKILSEKSSLPILLEFVHED